MISITQRNRIHELYLEANRRFVEYYLHFVQSKKLDFEAQKLELANFLKAVSVCEQQQLWEMLCQLLEAIGFLLQDGGYWKEYRRGVEAVLSQQNLLKDDKYKMIYFSLLNDYARLLHTQGEREKALKLYEDLIAFPFLANDLILAYTYDGLAQIFFSSGEYEFAEKYWNLATQIAQSLGNTTLPFMAKFFLNSTRNEPMSSIYVDIKHDSFFPRMTEWKRYIELQFQARRFFELRELSQAEHIYLEVCSLAKQLDDQDGLALALFHLGEVARMSNEPTQAMPYYRASERIALQLNHHIGLASVYAGIGRVYLLAQNYAFARPYLDEAVRLEREFGSKKALADNLFFLGYATANTGDIQYAERCFEEAKTLFVSFEPDRILQIDQNLQRLRDAGQSN